MPRPPYPYRTWAAYAAARQGGGAIEDRPSLRRGQWYLVAPASWDAAPQIQQQAARDSVVLGPFTTQSEALHWLNQLEEGRHSIGSGEVLAQVLDALLRADEDTPAQAYLAGVWADLWAEADTATRQEAQYLYNEEFAGAGRPPWRVAVRQAAQIGAAYELRRPGSPRMGRRVASGLPRRKGG